MYNEMVVLKHVQALSKMLVQPPSIFKKEIMDHFNLHAYKYYFSYGCNLSSFT